MILTNNINKEILLLTLSVDLSIVSTARQHGPFFVDPLEIRRCISTTLLDSWVLPFREENEGGGHAGEGTTPARMKEMKSRTSKSNQWFRVVEGYALGGPPTQ